jgi:hypothetical protein
VLVPGHRDGDVVVFAFGGLLFLAVAGTVSLFFRLIGDVVACGFALSLIFELQGLLLGRCALPALDDLCVSCRQDCLLW